MHDSPFPFQGPLGVDELGVREPLVDDLVERLSHHRVTALLSPRRYGKTSALQAVRARLEEVPTSVVVWLDFYELSGWGDLAVRFGKALAAANVRVGGRIESLAASMSLDLGLVKAELTRPANQRPDPNLIVHTLLDVLLGVVDTNPTTLIIDEFSGIANVDKAAGLFRTRLQHSYRNMGIAFAGSEPSTMQMLFADPAQPFYSQAEIVEVPPFTRDEVRRIVREGFDTEDRDPGALPGLIHEFTLGHPQRTMQLADACWRYAVDDLERTEDRVWTDAVSAVRLASDIGCERHFAALASGESLVLRLVANGDALFGAAAQFHDLSHSSAQGARRALLDRGDIRDHDGSLAVTDPFYADWLRRRFS